jgi:hypothetical protein
MLAAGLSHVEHRFIGGYLTTVKRWNLINSLWVSQCLAMFINDKSTTPIFNPSTSPRSLALRFSWPESVNEGSVSTLPIEFPKTVPTQLSLLD